MYAVRAAADPGTQDSWSSNAPLEPRQKSSTRIGWTWVSLRGGGELGGVAVPGILSYPLDANRCIPRALSKSPYERCTALMYGTPISLTAVVAATLSDRQPASQ